MKNCYLILIIVGICFTSCETVVEIDVPRKDSELVVNSFFNPDSSVTISLYESEFVLDEGDFEPVSGASAVLLDTAGSELGSLTEQGAGTYTSNVKPEPDEVYQIRVSKAGYNTVTATDRIPADTARLTKYEVERRTDFPNSISLSIWIDDPAGRDYYELYGTVESTIYAPDDTLIFPTELSFNSDDPTFDHFEGVIPHYLFFDDALFDGRETKLTLNTSTGYVQCSPSDQDCEVEHDVTLYLRKVSSVYYQYKETLNLQDRLDNDPFAEPAQVYDNIENGVGIFAGFRVNAYPIELPDNQDN